MKVILSLYFLIFYLGFYLGEKLVFADAPASQIPIHLTIEQSIQIALKNATPILQAENNETSASLQLLRNYGQFLPRLDVGANYSYSSGKTLYTFTGLLLVNSSRLGAQLNVSSNLNLFNGLADYARLKVALENLKSSQLNLSWAKQQVTLDIIQSFLQIVLDQKIIKIAKHNLESSRSRLTLMERQAQVGQISSADLFRQRAQTSSDELYFFNSQTKFNDDQILLLQKLKLNSEEKYIWDEPSLKTRYEPLLNESDEGLIKLALSQREDLQSYRANVQSNDWRIKVAQSDYWPKLNLSFDRNANATYLQKLISNGVSYLPPQQQSLIPQLGNQVDYSISLNLTWNLFDQFATRVNVGQARVQANNAEINLDDLTRSIINQIRQVKIDYNTALNQVKTAQSGVDAAKKAFETIHGRYEVGSSSFIDVLSAQSSLVAAEANLAQALIAVKLQDELLNYSVGNGKKLEKLLN